MFRISPACLVTIATCLIAVLPSSKTFSATNEPNNFASAVVDNLDPNFIRTITELAADIGLVGSDSLTVSNFLVSVDMKAAVEQQLASLKTQETEKKRLLENLQNNIEVQKQKIDMLKLTPQQLASIENYNRSVSHDPTFSEWVKAHQTWFDVGKDIVIGLFFLWLGIRVERWRTERAQREGRNQPRRRSRRFAALKNKNRKPVA